MAKALDLYVDQGSKFERLLVWTDEQYTPRDLTGWSAAMQIRDTAAGATALFELTTANGRIILGGVTGSITLKMSAAETRVFQWAKAVYDLELTPPSGAADAERLIEGTVFVSPEVTK